MSSRDEGSQVAERQPSSVPSAIVNMINAVLGAGIISLPYAWGQAGFTLGWLLFIFTALVTCYTLELLIDVADPLCRRGDINIVAYEQLAELIIGKVGRFLVILAQFLYAFGISIGYVVIIHDELSTALRQLTHASWFDDNKLLLTILVAVGVLLPISSLRDVSGLAKASFFCFFSAFALMTIVGYELVTDRDHICSPRTPEPVPVSPADLGPADASPLDAMVEAVDKSICDPQWTSFAETTVFNIYGIFVFTKACHHTQFQIYRSLGVKADPQTWKFVVRWAIVLCSVITSTCAMLVYGIFGVHVDSDFFKSFVKENTAVSLGRLMFSTLIMMSFPMQLFVTREMLQVMITMWLSRNVTDRDRSELAALADAEHAVPALNTYASSDPGSVGARPSPTRRSTVRSRYSTIDRKSRASEALSAAGGDIRGETTALMHYGTTLALFVVTFAIGLSTDNLGKILNLVGGVAGSLIAFLIPGLIGMFQYQKTGIEPTLGRPAAIAVTIFGVFTILVSSVFTFVSV